MSRFDVQLHTASQQGGGATSIAPMFIGEHDLNCGDPTTHRTITAGQTASTFIDASGTQLIWHCAPGNDPAKGHMMTGLDTQGIAYLSFSPKQSFTNVTSVCWDQNMNEMGGAKWINVFVVPVSDVQAHGGNLNYLAVQGEGFDASPAQFKQFVPTNSFHYTWLRGSTFGYQGRTLTMDFWQSGEIGSQWAGVNNDPAPRFTTCLNSGGNMVIHRPDGTLDTFPLGASFPSGPVRVIFQDASYNPTKHNGFVDHLTWHWDNITISVG